MVWHEIFVVIGSIATAFVAFLIFRQTQKLGTQTEEMKKTNELAHSPCLVPRQIQTKDESWVCWIENIGTASAKNIKITLSSSKGSKSINIFALTPGERNPSMKDPPVLIRSTLQDTIKLKGTYQDITGKEIPVDDEFPVSEYLTSE